MNPNGERPTKYIFVTGGVISSLGKGLAAASVGTLMESRGFKVALQQLDPYINVDPGTMSPFQHGEVYVTEDGAETDLDLGHYERFVRTRMGQVNNVTTGRIYADVIAKGATPVQPPATMPWGRFSTTGCWKSRRRAGCPASTS